jgi:hypothetical protein
MRNVLAGSSLAVVVVCIAAGCQGGGDTSYNAIKMNSTPELRGTAERHVDSDRHMWETMNVNVRSTWDDAGRAWLMDRPSYLTPSPVYSTTGMP